MKTYTELISIPDFVGRFNYLKIGGVVSDRTFGGYRYLNQRLYHSDEWKRVKREVILRDNGCDLGHPDFPIMSNIITIHHIEPITVEDLQERTDKVFDPNNLICCSHQTHNAIHYGDDASLNIGPVERTPFDACPWR